MTKAWTKARADSWDRYFRIRRILYKWKNPDLQVSWICSWRFKLESNHIPKFLATLTGTTLARNILNIGMEMEPHNV